MGNRFDCGNVVRTSPFTSLPAFRDDAQCSFLFPLPSIDRPLDNPEALGPRYDNGRYGSSLLVRAALLAKLTCLTKVCVPRLGITWLQR